MQFTSFSFLLFSAVVLCLYYCIPGKWQWILLLTGSYVFYLAAGGEYLIFLLFTTLSTFAATRLMGARLSKQDTYIAQNKTSLSREERKSYKAKVKAGNRVILTVCLAANFFILFLCKAALIEPVKSFVQGQSFAPFLALGLPMGISFYMFQSMGYCIDVYRGTVKAEKNLFRLALFVSYFPQLVQGPISKFSQLAPSLYAPHRFDSKTVSFGLQRLLWGYFKKLVIADRIAVAVIALRGYSDTGVGFFLLTLFYAIQIYADFTGGLDMTIGLSQALGIPLTENFCRPFFSKNIAEYWRRWHISLGEWMKDYIFYPISVSSPMLKLSKAGRQKLGNFGKRLPVYIASIATWFVTGIWHGLTPNFILWGMLNCFFIVLSEECTPLYDRFHNRFHLNEKRWYDGFQILRMFLLMNLIRACDLFPDVSEYFAGLWAMVANPGFGNFSISDLGLTGLDYGILGMGILMMFAVSAYQEKHGSIREALHTKPTAVRFALIFGLFLMVLLMGSYGIGYHAGNFIYNQF